jgi:hypothetical protein
VKAQRPADAAKLLETRVIENPKDPNSRLHLASLYDGACSHEKMTATLQAMLGNPRDFPHAYMRVGDFYGSLQDWDQALREFPSRSPGRPQREVRLHEENHQSAGARKRRPGVAGAA